MRVFFTDEFRRQKLTFAAPRSGDAGYDLYAVESTTIEPGSRTLIATGLHVEIPAGYVGLVKDRSSMAMAGLHTMAGVIDSSYRGELKILLLNTNSTEYAVQAGKKIAQLVVVPYYGVGVEVVEQLDYLSVSDRGHGGFGSTGQ
jgi:dUTP pyrophosphatase